MEGEVDKVYCIHSCFAAINNNKKCLGTFSVKNNKNIFFSPNDKLFHSLTEFQIGKLNLTRLPKSYFYTMEKLSLIDTWRV